jgi:hypothetical protein
MPDITEKERRKYEDEMEAKGKKHAEEVERQKKEYDEEFNELHKKAFKDHEEAFQKWRVEDDDYKHGPLKAFNEAKEWADMHHMNKRNKDYPKLRVKAPKEPMFKEAVVPNARRRFPLLPNGYFGGRRRTRRGRKTRSTRRR